MPPASRHAAALIFSQRSAAGSAGHAFSVSRMLTSEVTRWSRGCSLYCVPTPSPLRRALNSPPWPAIENLEERTLLSSATLAILNGNFTGTYSGTVIVNNNGSITKTPVTSTAFTMTTNNGAINFTSPVGNGTGTVDINRNIVGTVTANTRTRLFRSRVGKNHQRQRDSTAAFGSWSFSVNLGGGVTATGSGSGRPHPADVEQLRRRRHRHVPGSGKRYAKRIDDNHADHPGTFDTAINNGVVKGFASGRR